MLSHVTILHVATLSFLHNLIRFILNLSYRSRRVLKRNKTDKKKREILKRSIFHAASLGFFVHLNSSHMTWIYLTGRDGCKKK